MQINPKATINDSPTTLMGVNHVGLSVKDLDNVLGLYQNATGFKLIRREVIRNNAAADTLFGHAGIEYEVAVLQAPNMLFEFVAFKHNASQEAVRMPVEGPGMTHTCFQTASNDSGYDRFRDAGASILSRGDGPVDLGGYGVTYAYAYDGEGNMFEMEQLDAGPLAHDPTKGLWISQGHSMWMTQVALVTHDIEQLTLWYENIMAFAPNRKISIVDNPRLVEIADQDDASLKGSWFQMGGRPTGRLGGTTKMLELWQYRTPQTRACSGKREVTGFGYSYSIEVGNIQEEYARMKDLGVEFVSEPVLMEDYWQVFAHDIDGNVFALRQWVDADSRYSVVTLDK
jgi:catechol 2,3-dioxygenase-like lactoylglutathione lyase family enzyme